ncbi:hypothetical protein Bca52824_095438 [Brassica carinata]|uniref:Dolichol kinase n=1 Tax=Brassica carinata TaxID=52824 RepID=A0A8X7NYW3_BRACI|nr:hypothetical protein Bca52824_095438 [Brassica carinata]
MESTKSNPLEFRFSPSFRVELQLCQHRRAKKSNIGIAETCSESGRLKTTSSVERDAAGKVKKKRAPDSFQRQLCGRKKNESSSSSVWLTRASLTGTVLYGAACFVSLSMISHTGLNTSLKMLWMLFHGLTAVKLIRHLLCTFPACASIVVLFSILATFWHAQLQRFAKLIPVDLVSISYGIRRTETGIIVQRLSLCIYWVLLIVVSVSRFYNISRGSKVERILLRKYYHLMAVLMFLPALVLQPKFLDLAFGAALAVFITLEIIRFMNAFTDHRDSEFLIVSHFSLLLGCALPIWMSSGFNDRALSPFAGILSLDGDTMASMVGHKYGVLRWSKTGKKTVEGTAAGITSMMAVCFMLVPVLASMGYILSQGWWSLLVAVTATGMLEAYTAQLDNAFIPLVFTLSSACSTFRLRKSIGYASLNFDPMWKFR